MNAIQMITIAKKNNTVFLWVRAVGTSIHNARLLLSKSDVLSYSTTPWAMDFAVLCMGYEFVFYCLVSFLCFISFSLFFFLFCFCGPAGSFSAWCLVMKNCSERQRELTKQKNYQFYVINFANVTLIIHGSPTERNVCDVVENGGDWRRAGEIRGSLSNLLLNCMVIVYQSDSTPLYTC